MYHSDLCRRFNVLKLTCWRYIVIGAFVVLYEHWLTIEWHNASRYARGEQDILVNADTRRRLQHLASQSFLITENKRRI